MQRARDKATTEGFARLRDELSLLGWYHSIELPDGRVIKGLQTLEQMRARIARFPIPEDLRGKRVLDIGAWDGWFSFEMERRGATVVAVDSTKQDTLLEAKKLLNSKVEYIIEDICRLSPRDIGYFDIVLFFGVLYHTKHPLLALERVCELATDMACIESLVIDGPPDAIPVMEFWEGSEMAGGFDNWVGPNTACLTAMCRTAGLIRVELLTVVDSRAHVMSYRKWPEIARSGAAPELICVENTWTRDHNFSQARDDYFSLWFITQQTDLHSDNVYVQVGPYGCRPVGVCDLGGSGWQLNCKLPLGLQPGWHDVSLSVHQSSWSNRARIPVDMLRSDRQTPSGPVSNSVQIAVVTDGKTFEPDRVQVGNDSCVSVWATGVPDGTTKADVALRLDGADLPAVYVSAEEPHGKQINAMIPPKIEPGEYVISVNVRGVESATKPVELFK
jgi:tRNA (mo5U34)-methyltransferase